MTPEAYAAGLPPPAAPRAPVVVPDEHRCVYIKFNGLGSRCSNRKSPQSDQNECISHYRLRIQRAAAGGAPRSIPYCVGCALGGNSSAAHGSRRRGADYDAYELRTHVCSDGSLADGADQEKKKP